MNNTERADPADRSVSLDREVLFNTLIATAVDGIMAIDDAGRILVYSDACERLFGYSRAEALGKNVKMLMPPPYHAEHDSRYRETGERRIIGIGREVLGRRKNGTTFPMYLSVGEGKIEGKRIFIGVLHDLSERKRGAEVAQRLAAIVESSDDAIISKDLNGIVTSWNHSAERLFGYAASEIVGMPIATIIPADRQDKEPAIMDRIGRGERIQHFETVWLCKDGSLVDVSLTMSPMKNAEGGIVGVSKIAHNITERKATERRINELQGELLHATRLVSTGQLGAALAHELNQPLTAILNYAGVLRELGARDRSGEGEMLRDVVKRITEQTERAGEIIRRLRDFVAKRDPDRQIQDLNDTVRESLALGLVDSAHSGLHVHGEFATDLPPVPFDRIQIQQVMINLLRNAVEAMQDSVLRELHVSTFRDGDAFVRVSVADTGSGMAPEVSAVLFQPFVTTKAQGLGIGLSICRTIIESHGGRLWMEANDGGGTQLHFRLPLMPEEKRSVL
jgi:two-component system, LuxR family, sensor kinase FixL